MSFHQGDGTLGYTLLVVLLVFFELRARLIPKFITLPGLAIGLGLHAWLTPDRFAAAVIGAILGFSLLALLNMLYRRRRGTDGASPGAWKLLAMIGGFLGWKVKFWVAPVTMVFENAHDVTLDIESQQGGIEVAGLHREDSKPTLNGALTDYLFRFECQEGPISLRATGYRLYVRSEPRLMQAQCLSLEERGGISVERRVQEWRRAHLEELLACWELAREEKPLPAIAPPE